MSIGSARVLILVAAGLIGLAGCSIFPGLGDTAATDGRASPDTTGSIVARPAEPGPSGEPAADRFSEPLGVSY